MDTCNTAVSATHLLNEEIARQLFDLLPERGPLLAIMDRDGSLWPSHPDEFARLNLSAALLKDLRAKVDDGAEPVITQVGDTSVTVAQLSTDQTNCGYVLVALAHHSPESTLANLDLIEVLLGQVTLIARLIEKSHTLTRLQLSQYAAYRGSGPASN